MSLRSRAALTLVCFLLGVGLVAQLRARRGQTPTPGVPSTDQSVILGGLVVANAELRNEVQKLEAEVRTYEQASERVVLPQMVEQLGSMRIVNSRVQVIGGGVQVKIGAGVGAVDLQDVQNELRNVGAEAISLNGIRLTANSGLASDGDDITLDGQYMEAPFLFEAIGEPTMMATALNRPGGQLSILRVAYEGLEIEVKPVPRLSLAAATRSQTFVLAQPVK